MSFPKVKVIESLNPCGFCSTGTHGRCPTATLGGDGVRVWRCTCPAPECERSKQVRCFTCDHRELAAETKDIDPTTWRCFDPADCARRIEERLAANPTVQLIREVRATAAERVAGERAEAKERQYAAEGKEVPPARPRGEARPTSGACLHCGEPTKGGKFLPGHDAAYLSAATKAIKDEALAVNLELTLAAWDGLGISEALQNKLRKRVAA